MPRSHTASVLAVPLAIALRGDRALAPGRARPLERTQTPRSRRHSWHYNSATKQAPDFHGRIDGRPDQLPSVPRHQLGVCCSPIPSDFTPVCTTELGRVAPRSSRSSTSATSRGDPACRSTRARLAHQEWAKDILETQGHALNFPLLADPDKTVANLYGMIHPNANDTLTVRSVFVVGPDKKKIKLTLTYPASTGRNFDEVLRVIDSLQLTAKHKVATPSDWKQGGDVIIVPSVSDNDAKALFPERLEDRMPPLPTGASSRQHRSDSVTSPCAPPVSAQRRRSRYHRERRGASCSPM